MSNTWFGHPRGLATLFFTEMWERFSFYGMRAILVFALMADTAHGGAGLEKADAYAVYGLYMAGTYCFSVIGGWVSDRVLSPRRSVLVGGLIISGGHFTMALPGIETMYVGMLLIVLGTGLLKPTISTMVGLLYSNELHSRRDAGFSIFYMGINLGGLVGPIVCGFLGEKIGWHYGFMAAGILMLLGLIQFSITSRYLGNIGTQPIGARNVQHDQQIRKHAAWALAIFVALLSGIIFLLHTGQLHFNPVSTDQYSSWIIAAVTLAYFVYVLVFGRLSNSEVRNVLVIFIMVLASIFFWSGFEQAGTSFNSFAQQYTDRVIFGWEMPASWLQSVNSFFIILFAPLLAMLWMRLGAKNLDLSMPVKFGFGLIQVGLGFLVLFFASLIVLHGEMVAPTWLIVTYLLHATGELFLSPVGLSTVTKLAPKRYSAQMMGTWFMSLALGNALGGLIAGHLGSDAVNEMPYRFLMVFAGTAGVGLLLLLLAKWINRLGSSETT